jgi:hypothetical protein
VTHHEGHEDPAAAEQLSDSAAQGDERPSASSPNPTQERIDADPESGKPVDTEWEADA